MIKMGKNLHYIYFTMIKNSRNNKKYLSRNLTKYIQDPYSANHKTQIKEIKEDIDK